MRCFMLAVSLLVWFYSICGSSMLFAYVGGGPHIVGVALDKTIRPKLTRKKNWFYNPFILDESEEFAPTASIYMNKWLEMVANAQSVEDLLVCPLSGVALVDPVTASDGYTYERENLVLWLKSGMKLSPMTSRPLSMIMVGLGVPPNHPHEPWIKKEARKKVYFITDNIMSYALSFLKSGQNQERLSEVFLDPLNYNHLLDKPTVVFGDGMSYSFDSINQHFMSGGTKRTIRNPLHVEPHKYLFGEFITVDFTLSPICEAQIRWDQLVPHKTIAAIVKLIDKQSKAREKELRKKERELQLKMIMKAGFF